jgi:hypothetical protein
MPDDDADGVTRRSALQSIGAGAAASSVGHVDSLGDLQIFGNRDETDLRRVVIEADDEVTYEFSVTGLLSAGDAPADAVRSGTASATTTGRHSFEFSGEFTAFEVDGDATVRVDKQPFDYEAFPEQRIEIATEDSANYRVAASGALEVESGTARTRDRYAEGSVSGDSHTLSYSGELTMLDVEGDATVRRNGTVVDPTTPLPFDNLGNATVTAERNSGQPYTLEFGYGAGVAATTAKGNTEAATAEENTVSGEATKAASQIDYIGGFVSFDVPAFGRVTAPQQADYVRCEPTTDDVATFELRTTGQFENGEQTISVSTEDGTAELVEMSGRLTEVVVGPANGRPGRAVTLSLSPEADLEAARDSVALQLAAEFQRDKQFGQLTRAVPGTGRVRRDAGGLTAIVAPGIADHIDRDTVTFELTDLERADRGESILTERGDEFSGFSKYEWLTDDGYTARLETQSLSSTASADSVDESQMERNLFITDYSTDGASTAATGRSGVETTSVEFNVDAFRAANAQANGAVGTQGIIGDIWDAVTGAVDWVQGNFPNVDIETKDVEEVGGQLAITSHTVKFDLAEELAKSDDLAKGIKGGALLYSSAITFAKSDAASQLANDDKEVTSCASCSAVAQIAFDIGCGSASAYLCGLSGLVSGGVALVACATFLSILCNLPNTEESMKSACREAGAC